MEKIFISFISNIINTLFQKNHHHHHHRSHFLFECFAIIPEPYYLNLHCLHRCLHHYYFHHYYYTPYDSDYHFHFHFHFQHLTTFVF